MYLAFEDHKKQTKVEAFVFLLSFWVRKEGSGMVCNASLVTNKEFIDGL